jgi:hypothetical protein
VKGCAAEAAADLRRNAGVRYFSRYTESLSRQLGRESVYGRTIENRVDGLHI